MSTIHFGMILVYNLSLIHIFAYPFGYGDSYTDFTYSNFNVTESDDAFDISLTVTNSGKTYSGKETVQVYFQSPYTDYDKANGIEKAAVELAGFAKTDVLAPGASETVNITVNKSELRTYDANKAKTYIVDAGDYYFTVGTDSHNALNNILAAVSYTHLDTLKIDEDTPIENRMITNTLESAQKKLEGRNFEIRKNVLKYDDVMNQQREIIYGQRHKVLDGEDISAEMHKICLLYTSAAPQSYLPFYPAGRSRARHLWPCLLYTSRCV